VRFYDYFQDATSVSVVLEYLPNGTLEDFLRLRGAGSHSVSKAQAQPRSQSQSQADPDSSETASGPTVTQTQVTSQVQDLDVTVGRLTRVTEPEGRFFLSDILSGLEFLHKNRIFHREINLGNLLVDNDMRLKIGGGFGCAVKFGTNFNEDYRSEEERGGLRVRVQRESDNPDSDSGDTNSNTNSGPNLGPSDSGNESDILNSYEFDVWSLGVCPSLGVTLYTMLVGKPPFDKSVDESEKGNFSPEDLSEEAKALIRSLLHRDPTKRPTLEEIRTSAFLNPKNVGVTRSRQSEMKEIQDALRVIRERSFLFDTLTYRLTSGVLETETQDRELCSECDVARESEASSGSQSQCHSPRSSPPLIQITRAPEDSGTPAAAHAHVHAHSGQAGLQVPPPRERFASSSSFLSSESDHDDAPEPGPPPSLTPTASGSIPGRIRFEGSSTVANAVIDDMESDERVAGPGPSRFELDATAERIVNSDQSPSLSPVRLKERERSSSPSAGPTSPTSVSESNRRGGRSSCGSVGFRSVEGRSLSPSADLDPKTPSTRRGGTRSSFGTAREEDSDWQSECHDGESTVSVGEVERPPVERPADLVQASMRSLGLEGHSEEGSSLLNLGPSEGGRDTRLWATVRARLGSLLHSQGKSSPHWQAPEVRVPPGHGDGPHSQGSSSPQTPDDDPRDQEYIPI